MIELSELWTRLKQVQTPLVVFGVCLLLLGAYWYFAGEDSDIEEPVDAQAQVQAAPGSNFVLSGSNEPVQKQAFAVTASINEVVDVFDQPQRCEVFFSDDVAEYVGVGYIKNENVRISLRQLNSTQGYRYEFSRVGEWGWAWGSHEKGDFSYRLFEGKKDEKNLGHDFSMPMNFACIEDAVVDDNIFAPPTDINFGNIPGKEKFFK